MKTIVSFNPLHKYTIKPARVIRKKSFRKTLLKIFKRKSNKRWIIFMKKCLPFQNGIHSGSEVGKMENARWMRIGIFTLHSVLIVRFEVRF